MEDKRVFGVGALQATPEGLFNKCVKDLVPYIADTYDMSRVEASTITSIVLAAITQKLFASGIAKLPFGDLRFIPIPKETYPLRIKLYTPLYISKFLNIGDNSRSNAIQACLRPEHYEALAILQKKAYTYKDIKKREKDDQIQEDSD